jgi:glyoxylase-like metal-dependent hydrolase (beta-lactamase superfamily II)
MGVWQEIGDRVWVRRYEYIDQTIPAVAGDNGLLVLDTRSSSRQGNELRDDLRELDLPIGWVVNSHMHADHTFGNAAFAGKSIELWGHVRCAAAVRDRGEQWRMQGIEEEPELADELRETKVVPPDRLTADSATIDLGGRTVELRYLGRGHTDNDLVLTVSDAPVVLVGDLLEKGAPPYFGDGFPLDWPATAQGILAVANGPVVPGHGDVGDRAFVERSIGELEEIARLGRAVATGEIGLDEAISRSPYGPKRSREPLERAASQARGELD